MVSLVKHDLDFILKQIKIAEAHSGGTPLSQIYVDANGNIVPANAPGAVLAISDPLVPYGLRTVDGSLNNLSLNRDDWGSADNPFPRITDPYWRDEDDDAMPHPNYVPGDATIPDTTGPLVDQNNNYGQTGSVVDADPRLISNLIVDQTLGNPAAVYAGLVHAGVSSNALTGAMDAIRDAYAPVKDAAIARAAANAATNPATGQPIDPVAWAALDAAADELEAAAPAALTVAKALAATFGIEMQGNTVLLPNVAPDEGLSAPYNSWFTLFGQFFDHGLDLVAKKGGTIYIPLSPDDPLYNPASPRTNFMVVTRTDLDADNTTTPWVDQNQTYGSTASKQLFMREYEMDENGKPVATGSLLESVRGLATWADVKQQAALKLGFELTDADVGNIPLFAMDPYGEFIRGPNGLPQIIAGFKPDGSPYLVEGNLANPVNPSAIDLPDGTLLRGSGSTIITIAPGQTVGAVRTDHAFLDDIAHAANTVNDRGQKMYSDANDAIGINATPITNPGYAEGGTAGSEPYPALNPAFNSQQPVSEENPRYIAGNLPYLAVNSAFIASQPISATNPLYVQSATPSAGANGDFDPDQPVSATNMPFVALSRLYDDELLDAHYITGDGRGNENIGLSAVHHVFHSEHNRLVEQVKELALTSGDLDFLNEWLRDEVDAIPTDAAGIAALKWDGERLFQAARFTNEMEYQHLVFEEFARKVQPDVDAFVFNPQSDIDPAIFAEFAHVVYRFGHSMLNETVDSTQADGTNSSMDLFDAFLNPLAFGGPQFDADGNPILKADGTQLVLDHDHAAGAIVRGMTSQQGNEIDEFVTHVLRNQLVGIPLDLAAINIARGRETGIPPLNEARRQFQEIANGDTQLEAYTSWADFALNLKNPASIVNFIAAYGTHESIKSATTMEAKRDAAMLLVFGGNGAPEDRLDFLNATGSYAGGKLGGLEDVDLWVGGLAEKKMAFGGMLGSTFSFVFELQLENLQNADRFYYLSRVQGLNLLNELENNSLAKMVLNNTDLGESGYAVPGDIFSLPDHVLYVDENMQIKFGHQDPTHDDPYLEALSKLVERVDNNNDGIAEYLRVNTNDHLLIQGTNGNDNIVAGGGDDSVWGMDGNDKIEAGYGVDKIHGGKGDDIITNSGTDIGEVDMLHGEEGNDVIHGGSGLALIFGNQGQDFIITGPDGKEAFGGTGNDFILGGEGGDFLLGNEGDDWLEAGNGFDTTAGDNSELFFNSTIIGHDVMFAGQNEHDFDAESGDDIMVQGESVMRNEGMWGFDWAIHKGSNEAADADLKRPIFTTDAQDILRNRYDQVEALSGWDRNDALKGDDRGSAVDGEEEVEGTPGLAGAEGTMVKQELTQAGVDRIDGMRALLGDWVAAVSANLTAEQKEAIIAFDDGNILLGGGGNDVIEGRGGNDVIDGDKWLNVRIKIEANGQIYSAERMGGKVYLANDFVEGVLKVGAVAQFGGRTLDALMLNATLNPGQLSIVREIVKDDGAGDTDVAVFSDVSENYTFTRGTDGSYIVSHTGFDAGNGPDGANLVSDGTDKLWNIERLRFADGEFDLAQLFNVPATGVPIISDVTPTEGQQLTVDTSAIQDGNGVGAFSYQWQALVGGTTWTDIAGATSGTFTPQDLALTAFGAQAGLQLRVVVSFTDARGNPETVTSAPTGPVGVNWDGFLGQPFNGTAGDDIADGGGLGEVFTGGGGNDRIDGGGNLLSNDVANYAGGAGEYDFSLNASDQLTVADRDGGEGTDTLTAIEQLRFGGNTFTLVNGSNTGQTLTGGTGFLNANRTDILLGHGGNDTLNANGGNDVLVGGSGNDTVNGGDGNDLIIQVGATDGRDIVNGGNNVDTYQVNGSAGAETFTIYSRTAAQAAIPGLTLAVGTEIVIARDGAVIAELDNIEEIRVNTLQVTSPAGSGGGTSSGDTIQVVGDFNGTSLLFSTITIDGNSGNDTIDITSLQSAHRIVFKSNGGNDTIVGTLRAQDVIELAPGQEIGDYQRIVNDNGTVTLKSATHSVTYMSDGNPILKEHEEDEDDDNPEGNEKPIVEGERFTIRKGEILSITAAQLLANDYDPDGGMVSLVELDEDEHGTAVLNSDGTITFTPKAGFTGEASFTYMVSDSQGGTTEGTVSITVEKPAPVVSNPMPVAVNGGRGNDRLVGDGADDQIRGGNGHDRLDGNAGADRMWGGRGNDAYIVDDRGDRVYESHNQGTDTVKASVSYSLAGTHVEKLVLTGSADLNGTGNSLNNSLTGNSGNNVLKGGGGQDTLKGMAGNDKLYGGSGNDKLEGGRGDDHLYGGKGDDRLHGGSGDDRLDGGSGNNRLTGGSGDDIFVFNKKHDMDTVTDFRVGHDKVDVSGLAGVDKMSDLYTWQSGSSTVVWHDSAVLVLKGVKESDLDSSDFIF
ncbi:peroxidase family protein [Microvirga sp. CF3062]|uniref:peroxidase family protein n=1 Tax=Microvirga sp. CF3062 TaxID=3110182 RepID=UPI002E7751C2|nr:peroxidase family protein [Microvirga sp. CF3062]MEE1656240.1 peroxidase family protein [Microvirga sp. CF3062]